jgi:hypothetical protein
MPGNEHTWITEAAVELLPEWQKEIIAPEKENLCKEYCKYPDKYYGVSNGEHEKAKPYHFETDGIQFHYIPDTPIVEKYRYWIVDNGKLKLPDQPENLNWKHAKNGFEYYLKKSINSLKGNKLKDALSFAGCLIHMLEDSTFSLHSLEGPYGTDLFVLDRLFDCGDDPSRLPNNLMASETPRDALNAPNHKPELLGNSIDEAVFILYSRYVNATLSGRKLTFKIIQKKFEGIESPDLYNEMFRNSVILTADVLYTIFCLASERREKLPYLYLSDIEPVERPWGLGFYRFITLLKNKALNPHGQITPLKLIIDGAPKEYQKGISFGSHAEFSFVYEIPAGIYKSLDLDLGLQAEFVNDGEIRIQILNNGNSVFDQTFDKATPSATARIDAPSGLLKIIGSSPNGARNKTVASICAPALSRNQ